MQQLDLTATGTLLCCYNTHYLQLPGFMLRGIMLAFQQFSIFSTCWEMVLCCLCR